jgi:hypothetical protein
MVSSVTERICQTPDSLPELFDGLQAENARTKYGCLKSLRLLSEKQPAVIYPYFDRVAALLGSDSVAGRVNGRQSWSLGKAPRN